MVEEGRRIVHKIDSDGREWNLEEWWDLPIVRSKDSMELIDLLN